MLFIVVNGSIASYNYNNFSVVATVDFEQSTYKANELDGSVQPVIVISNPLSSDVTIQVSGEYQCCRSIFELFLIKTLYRLG